MECPREEGVHEAGQGRKELGRGAGSDASKLRPIPWELRSVNPPVCPSIGDWLQGVLGEGMAGGGDVCE